MHTVVSAWNIKLNSIKYVTFEDYILPLYLTSSKILRILFDSVSISAEELRVRYLVCWREEKLSEITSVLHNGLRNTKSDKIVFSR